MSIVYSLVCRGSDLTILADHADASATGNFTPVIRALLKQLNPSQNEIRSFKNDRDSQFAFHVIIQNSLIYLAMTDISFSRSLCQQFLERIQQIFLLQYGARANTAIAYQFNKDFSHILAREMLAFSQSNTADSKIQQIRGHVSDVRDNMVNNIDRVLERGEKIELLVDKTEELEFRAFKFERQGHRVKKFMWRKQCKWLILAFVIIAMISLFIAMGLCGATFEKCKT